MKYIQYASAVSVLAPLFLLVWRRKSLITFHVPLAVLLVAGALSDILYFYLSSKSLSNVAVVHLFYLIQYLCIVIMYFYMFDTRKYLFRFLALLVVFTSYFVVDNFMLHDIYTYNNNSITVATVAIITLSILYYRHMLLNLPAKSIARYSPFWINSAVAFYFLFNSVLFFASHYVFNSMPEESAWIFWSYHNVNNVVKNILFAVAIYFAKEE
jgi:hypothetical protein